MASKSGGETEALANFGNNWPVLRKNKDEITQDEKDAIDRTKSLWDKYLELFSNESDWTIEKQVDNITISSINSELLNMKLFKTKCTLNRDWRTVCDLLLDYENNPKWNDTCEKSATVVTLPLLDDDDSTREQEGNITKDKKKTCWVAYFRMSDSVSKLISQRDFCSCFVMEKSDTHALYAGSPCEIELCPKLQKCVRGQQSALAVKIEQIDEKRCAMSQIISIDFKGWLPQSLVNMSMVKALVTYAECLSKQVDSSPR